MLQAEARGFSKPSAAFVTGIMRGVVGGTVLPNLVRFHMPVDAFVKILDAISRLLTVLAWPVIFSFVLFHFREHLKRFFDDLGDFSFKGGGVEASVKKKIHAAASIAAASATDSRERGTPQQAADAATKVVSEVLTKRGVKRASKTKILWVDDQPDNNISQREVLQDLGMTICLALSTQQAMDLLSIERFDLVISDMGRPPDQRAGYTLLAKMKDASINTPLIFYASEGSQPEHCREAKAKGAFSSTNRATDLFLYIFRALDAL